MATNGYKYIGSEPENREPEIERLLKNYITPVQDAYDRNHSEYPTNLDAKNHKITITGLIKKSLTLSIDDLRKFPQHEVLCCLQCAGNRRHTMRTKLKEVNGIDWFDGAVANCTWKGPRLRDILLEAGLVDDLNIGTSWKGHVECISDVKPCEDTPIYGGSISLSRAMREDGDCILALEMNGRELTVKHGYPVRAVFPGILGARSVKWLNQIIVQKKESANHYQQRDYKILPPAAVDAKAAEQYWDSTPPMNDMPVNSIIGYPASGSTIKLDADGVVEVRGYALPAGSDGPVVKVEISSDNGQSWIEAELDFGGHEAPGLHTEEGQHKIRWAWCLWKARIHVPKGKQRRIVSRATDRRGNVQPQEAQWTLRGVGYNGWGEADNLSIE